ncbi:hypothetical protein A1D17_27470 [Pseudomonas fluorescens]|uniref:Uncharacterized protein n=1 Tax=Pseudomonas fluorescens TaxID=294 RepID=A0A166Q4B2_PSEFL|nr:hypothetical protein A1D17_27470 [Pseudomonas fluorescens]
MARRTSGACAGHVGVGADGDPFQQQEQRAEHDELRGNRSSRVDELRQECSEQQNSLGIARCHQKLLPRQSDNANWRAGHKLLGLGIGAPQLPGQV